jgi:hypothetical protein
MIWLGVFIGALVAGAVLFGVVAWQDERQHRRLMAVVLETRQQRRSEARRMAAGAVGAAPVTRAVRRDAAREVGRMVR